jgi:hypothetical protein
MTAKDQYAPFQNNADKPNRLAIVDPNLADNNISGGTAEIDLVFRCFQEAYIQLSARMGQRQSSGPTSGSLLIDLLGGDYGAYGLQRERLRRIYSSRYGPSNHTLPPKPTFASPPSVALPKVAVAARKESALPPKPSFSSPAGVALPKVAVAAPKQSNAYQTNGRRTNSGEVSTLQIAAGGSWK